MDTRIALIAAAAVPDPTQVWDGGAGRGCPNPPIVCAFHPSRPLGVERRSVEVPRWVPIADRRFDLGSTGFIPRASSIGAQSISMTSASSKYGLPRSSTKPNFS